MNDIVDKLVSIAEFLGPIVFLVDLVAYLFRFIEYSVFFVIMIISIAITVFGLALYFLDKKKKREAKWD